MFDQLKVSSEIQSDGITSESNINEEEKTSVAESMTDMQTSLTDSVDIQQQVQSTSSLAESSTITESSSSESATSLRPASSIPSSESTVVGPIIESTTDEQQMTENSEIEKEDHSENLHSLPSEKRDVIDSWMNTRETNPIEYEKYSLDDFMHSKKYLEIIPNNLYRIRTKTIIHYYRHRHR